MLKPQLWLGPQPHVYQDPTPTPGQPTTTAQNSTLPTASVEIQDRAGTIGHPASPWRLAPHSSRGSFHPHSTILNQPASPPTVPSADDLAVYNPGEADAIRTEHPTSPARSISVRRLCPPHMTVDESASYLRPPLDPIPFPPTQGHQT